MTEVLAAQPEFSRRPRALGDDCVAPGRHELGLVGLLILFYLAGEELLGAASYDAANMIGPLWLAGALLLGAAQTASAHPAGVWTGLFWLRIATVIYFAFGSVIPFFLNEVTRTTIEAFHYADAAQMFKVNLITACGAFMVLATVAILSLAFPFAPSGDDINADNRELLMWGLLFGVIGGIIKYVFAVPYAFGLLGDVLPAVMIQMSLLVSVAIYLLSAWAFAAARAYIPVLAAVTGFDMLVGLLTFAKTEVMFSLIMFLLATQHVRVRRLHAVAAISVAILCFNLVSPIVDYGRSQLWIRYQSISGAGLAERLEILRSYVAGTDKETANPFAMEFQAPLARLTYMNAAAFAVFLYDTGIPANTLEASAIVAIPRFLWPDKPNLNYLTSDFNTLATNNPLSLSWPGQYAEAYWNFGWPGIAAFLVPLGIIYFFLSRYAVAVFASGSWAYFPVVLFGMKFGTEVITSYATAVTGALLLIVVAHIGCWALDRGLRTFLRYDRTT